MPAAKTSTDAAIEDPVEEEWNPSMIPGCILWLRSDLGVTVNQSTDPAKPSDT